MDSGEQFGPLVWVAIVCMVVAASIVLWFLLAAPRLSRQTKVLLLFGIAVFPIGAAMATNLVGFHATTERPFLRRLPPDAPLHRRLR